MPKFETRLSTGQLEIITPSAGAARTEELLTQWQIHVDESISRGWSGLRLCCDADWLAEDSFDAYLAYESGLHDRIEHLRAIACCSYPLHRCSPSTLIQLGGQHRFSVVQEGAGWRIIEGQESLLRRRSEERFQIAADHLPLALNIYDSERRLLFANRTCLAWTGLKLADVAGKRDEEVHTSEIWSQYLPAFIKTIETRSTQEVEFVADVPRTGRPERSVRISARYTPILDERGKVKYVIALFDDITKRHWSEQELRDSRERFAALSAATFEGSIISEDGVILDANEQAAQVFGYSLTELKGRTIAELLVPEDRERIARQIRTGSEKQHEANIVRKDGTIVPVEARPRMIRYRGRRVRITAIRDISEHKAAERALREAGEHKDRFLAILGHELRNPLATIASGVELMRRAGSPERAGRLQEALEREVRNLARLVEDLLDVSRIGRGKIVLKLETLRLDLPLKCALESMEGRIEAASRGLTLELATEELWVEGDSLRLEQIFINLLQNAIKFTGTGGNIKLAARRDGNEGVVEVHDDGIGIPADKLPWIFELFTQLDGPAQRSKTGLGIGLALARSLVEMHGGKIEARSEGPGKGSTFLVRLPLVPPPLPAAHPATSAADVCPMHILIIDDNEGHVELLRAILEERGHHVDTAFDGERGLEEARRVRPEVVLLDIEMPGMNGYQVAQELRRSCSWPLLIVAVSGYGQPQDKERSRAAGIDHHLVKPVSYQTLAEVLTMWRTESTRTQSP